MFNFYSPSPKAWSVKKFCKILYVFLLNIPHPPHYCSYCCFCEWSSAILDGSWSIKIWLMTLTYECIWGTLCLLLFRLWSTWDLSPVREITTSFIAHPIIRYSFLYPQGWNSLHFKIAAIFMQSLYVGTKWMHIELIMSVHLSACFNLVTTGGIWWNLVWTLCHWRHPQSSTI